MKENRVEIGNPLLVDEVLADLPSEGAQERRLARYAAAKQRQGLVSEYILQRNLDSEKPTLEAEYKSLKECGSFLVFWYYFTRDQYKMVKGCTCKKHLLCALCAIRRAAKCIAIYSEKINQVRADSKVELEELMITFTIKNGVDLAERYDHLLESMKRIIQKRRDALKANPLTNTELKHVSGAVYSYEVTYSAEKGFHPHCHMIALVPKGIFEYSLKYKKEKYFWEPSILKAGLVEDWKQITGDSFIIDVRLIEDKTIDVKDGHFQGSRLEALVEVFKYALKMNQISKDSEAGSEENVRIQVEAYEVLRGRRMIGSFGTLWGVKIPENLNDRPINEAELPYIEMVYQYSGLFGYQLASQSEVQIARTMPSEHHRKSMAQNAVKGKGESKWKKKVDQYLLDLQ